jgi:5'-3' exoribonuclease 1
MGVPKFYRWLSERYPLINQNIDDATLLPEYDNLYLDMNGLIHNATHGSEGVTKKVEEKDMMLSILGYVDMMMKMVKPKKLLYMAVDGVAPRAKMNQQRSRRFRTARDLLVAKKEAATRGEVLHDDDVFDSNCITPGTEFMCKVSAHMKYFIRRKLKEDPLWQQVQVIFSGHEVPGEGEHKLVEYIRIKKMQPDYDPNTRHCMAGLDADLIMLALATHEPHFSLLREQVDFTSFKKNIYGTKTITRETKEKKWQLLHIGLVREYLEIDMRPPIVTQALSDLVHEGHETVSSINQLQVPGMSFPYDGERVIDDMVLIAALLGNDFIPHLPSLDIGEAAIDFMFSTYREHLPSWGGYLVSEGLIHLERLQKFMKVIGE